MENLVQFLDLRKGNTVGRGALKPNEISVYYSNIKKTKTYNLTFGRASKIDKSFLKVGYFANFIVLQLVEKEEKGSIKGHGVGHEKQSTVFSCKEMVSFILGKFGEKIEPNTKKRFVYEYEKSGEYFLIKIKN